MFICTTICQYLAQNKPQFSSFQGTVLKSVTPHAEFLKYFAFKTLYISVIVPGVKSQIRLWTHLQSLKKWFAIAR